MKTTSLTFDRHTAPKIVEALSHMMSIPGETSTEIEGDSGGDIIKLIYHKDSLIISHTVPEEE